MPQQIGRGFSITVHANPTDPDGIGVSFDI